MLCTASLVLSTQHTTCHGGRSLARTGAVAAPVVLTIAPLPTPHAVPCTRAACTDTLKKLQCEAYRSTNLCVMHSHVAVGLVGNLAGHLGLGLGSGGGLGGGSQWVTWRLNWWRGGLADEMGWVLQEVLGGDLRGLGFASWRRAIECMGRVEGHVSKGQVLCHPSAQQLACMPAQRLTVLAGCPTNIRVLLLHAV
jgi:hypothetical protein